MPDEDGKLSQKEEEIISDWIREKTKEKTLFCQVCGSNSWGLEKYAVAPTILRKSLVLGGGSLYPYVMLTCNTCGYTLYFNAVTIGLFPPAEEEKSGGK